MPFISRGKNSSASHSSSSEFGLLPSGSLQPRLAADGLARPLAGNAQPPLVKRPPFRSFSRPFSRLFIEKATHDGLSSSNATSSATATDTELTSITCGSSTDQASAHTYDPKPGPEPPVSISVHEYQPPWPGNRYLADRPRSRSAAPDLKRPQRPVKERVFEAQPRDACAVNLPGAGLGSSNTYIHSSVEPEEPRVMASQRTPDGRSWKRCSSVPARLRQQSQTSPGPELPGGLTEARNSIMAMWLYQGQLQRQYASGSDASEGVILKVTRNKFACCPAELRNQPGGLFEMVQKMNVRCAMTVNTIVVRALIGLLKHQGFNSVPLEGGLRVQILVTMADLAACQLHHFAAFIEDRQILIVWDDDPKAIFSRAHAIEEKAMALVWGSRRSPPAHRRLVFSALSTPSLDLLSPEPQHSRRGFRLRPGKRLGCFGAARAESAVHEEAATDADYRPVKLTGPSIVAIALALCISTQGLGLRILVRDSSTDGNWSRLGLVAFIPITFFCSLFFFYSLVANLFLIFGSTKVVRGNSRFYSGAPPRRAMRYWKDRSLPHVTIQMPVYKESLTTVIRPTVMSLKTAISTYEMQGGTANIYINDDGMQLLSPNQAQERRDFYDEHDIGWVARPRHNPEPLQSSLSASVSTWTSGFICSWVPSWFCSRGLARGDHKGNRSGVDGSSSSSSSSSRNNSSADERTFFVRRGKFKKASNMNYALHVSNRVEDKLSRVQRFWRQRLHPVRPGGGGINWSRTHEAAAYDRCLAEVLNEDRGRTWAEGNVRIGDYILLVDCDTRVPADCLLHGVTEMDQSPEVAILQYTSGVMQLTDSFFENSISWFTNLIYSAITFAVASGDCCPFVGHNALIRWEALQDAAAYRDEKDGGAGDGYEKYWSESHVSEDFDMAIRLQTAGWQLRYVSYTGTHGTTTTTKDRQPWPSCSFQEGVSLTVYDELTRWEKYAYGCSELLFNPFREWPRRGPVTRRFLAFALSRRIRLPVKLTVASYMGTYYAIGAGWIMTAVNYLLVGWYPALYRPYYLDSFTIYVSLLFVFPFLGNIALAVHRYRLGQKGLGEALWENFKWAPVLMVFLGGISLHISHAVAAHFLGLDMSWGATAKEVERIGFVEELGRILRRFKWTFAFVVLGLAGVVACSSQLGAAILPRDWLITEGFAIYPLAACLFCHFAVLVVLNPALMTFTW